MDYFRDYLIIGGSFAVMGGLVTALACYRKGLFGAPPPAGDATAFVVYHRASPKQLVLPTAALEGMTFVPQRVRDAAAQWDAAEAARKTHYDDADDAHVALLRRLWAAGFGGGAEFERRSERWTELGFQQADPVTDLRGGGLLSLEHFVAFAETHNAAFRDMVRFNVARHAEGSHSWFLPAVVSIQFSAQLLLGEFTPHAEHVALVLSEDTEPTAAAPHVVRDGIARLHHALLLHFYAVWQAKNPHVMEYTQFVGPNVTRPFFSAKWVRPVALAAAPQVQRMGGETKKTR
jgi:hypothetical protein